MQWEIFICIPMYAPSDMAGTNGDTSMRVGRRTKEKLRRIVKARGFPESISDDDALILVLDWVEEYFPAKTGA